MNEPLSFGLISDIQYADIEVASNFSGSEQRDYRGAATAARASMVKMLSDPSLSFVAHLGDLIDGQNAGEYGQGLSLDAPQSEEALQVVLNIWSDCSTPIHHIIGNHELYNFTWAALDERLNQTCGLGEHHLPRPHGYGSFSPAKGWRVISLNSYEINVIKPRDEHVRSEAEAILTEMNPNFGAKAPYNFFEGLPPHRLRYVPFNGGFGSKQLAWLMTELQEAQRRDERCIILSHLPCYGPSASLRNLAFDADDLLLLIGQYAELISAYFAGHRHSGGAATDPHGVHHITIQSPLTHGECAAIIKVDEETLSVKGIGAHRSYHFHL